MLKYKVYFEEGTGAIQSISNVEQSFPNFFETDYEDVIQFIEHGKSMSLCKVVYNVNTSAYNIVSKEEKVELLVNDLIFQITPREIYQIGVWKNDIRQCWTIKLSDETKQQLTTVKSRPDQKLTFSITQHNNPNILYRLCVCMLGDLIDQTSVDFKYISQEEEELSKFSVYTNKKFEKYTYGVING